MDMFDRERAHDCRLALFGGSGEVRVWSLLPPTALAPFTAALACELSPGGEVGPHLQEHFPEIVICVSGTGLASVGDQTHELRPGFVVTLPQGETLALKNGSDSDPFRYLIIKARTP